MNYASEEDNERDRVLVPWDTVGSVECAVGEPRRLYGCGPRGFVLLLGLNAAFPVLGIVLTGQCAVEGSEWFSGMRTSSLSLSLSLSRLT